MKRIISKAATLLEALPYIQRFRSQIFVVKYGGSFMDSPDPEERHRVARDVVFLEAVGINPVVVHGGGKTITRALEEAGVKSEFVHGYRVTAAASAKIVDRVLSREINPEIVKAIEDFGGKARGFAGPEIFRCRKYSARSEKGEDVDLGFVGEVCEVNVEPLRECIKSAPLGVHERRAWFAASSKKRFQFADAFSRERSSEVAKSWGDRRRDDSKSGLGDRRD